MKIVRSFFKSFVVLIILIVIVVAFSYGRGVAVLGCSGEPKKIQRVILFTEIGNSIFETEKRDTGGLTVDTLYSESILKLLRSRGYEVSRAVDRFNDENADIIRRLNRAGVRVWVWPLHTMDDGYWHSADNASKLPDLYDRFMSWLKKNGLEVHGIMLDMEPDYNAVQLLKKNVKGKGTLGTIRYLLKNRDPITNYEARTIYASMIDRMKRDGFEVSTFNYPYILDDLLDGDFSIAEMFHIAYVPSDIDAYMLYRSFYADSGLGYGEANIKLYAKNLKGGSASFGSYMRKDITFEQFADDLRLAARYSPVVHIYSLEALVKRGWLETMKGIDLTDEVDIPLGQNAFINAYQHVFIILDLFTGPSVIYPIGLLSLTWIVIGVFIYRRGG